MFRIFMAAMFFILVMACGTEKVHCPAPGATPPPPPPPSGGLSWSADIKPILDRYCASCHGSAAFVLSETGFRNSQTIRNKLANNQMPPPTAPLQMPDSERRKLLFFYDRSKN